MRGGREGEGEGKGGRRDYWDNNVNIQWKFTDARRQESWEFITFSPHTIRNSSVIIQHSNNAFQGIFKMGADGDQNLKEKKFIHMINSFGQKVKRQTQLIFKLP